MAPAGRRLSFLLAILTLGCGKIDDGAEPASLDGLGAPEAESHCHDPLVNGPAEVTVQRTRDIDGSVRTAIVWFDADGNVLSQALDDDGDGSIELRSVTYLEYGASGDWTLMSEDLDANGTPDYVVARELDDAGRILREQTDSNGDGAYDVTFSYLYDALGRELSMEADWNGDGENDSLSVTVYDDLGGSVTTYDEDLDGAPDRVITRGWVEEGGVWLEQVDLNADGTSDEQTRTTYDEEARVVEVLTQRNWAVEPFAAVTRYEYSDAGELVRELTDADGDGVVEAEKTYAYEVEGSEHFQTTNRYFGGTLVETCTLTSGNGGEQLSTCDSGPDGTLDLVVTHAVCP